LRWRLAGDDAGQGALFDADSLLERHAGRGEFSGTEFFHVNARRIINRVPESSRMPFRYTINAYRGCSHACVYCFARPTHEYLGLDIGEDFETKIVVKINAVERVRAELASGRWSGDPIAMGTNTDPYQRCEGKYHLTRGIIKALLDAGNPFSLLTKSSLILRDRDLLAGAAAEGLVTVSFSIGTLDEEVWRLTEPGTPHPRQRLGALEKLTSLGVPCSVLAAPLIPGLSDAPEQVEAVEQACRRAGARSVTPIRLHLRPGVKEHFFSWLSQARPEMLASYQAMYRGRSYLQSRPRAEEPGQGRKITRAGHEAPA
jgi:DNA repair photolyase